MYLWDVLYFYQGSSGLVSYGALKQDGLAKPEGQGQRRGATEGLGPCSGARGRPLDQDEGAAGSRERVLKSAQFLHIC